MFNYLRRIFMSKRHNILIAFVVLLIGLWCLPGYSANAKQTPGVSGQKIGTYGPIVIRSIKNDTTKIPLRDMKPVPFPTERHEFEIPNRVMPKALTASHGNQS